LNYHETFVHALTNQTGIFRGGNFCITK